MNKINFHVFVLTLIFLSIKGTDQESSNIVKALPKSSFYPYGVVFGDKLVPKVDDGFVGPISTSIIFPFFQTGFSLVYVNTNGLLTFKIPVTAYTPLPFPLPDIIGVAPFWADVDTRNGGEIYYREILDDSTLNRIAVDIRQTYPSFVNFRPIWAFITTYDDVAAYGSNSRINNTFQAVIVTNGKHSFTIFNYGLLMWSYGTASNGVHAQAGFNYGDSKTYYVLPGSFTANVLKISELSNINNPGKWIFRVDSANITESGCNDDGYVAIKPNMVFYVGGDYLVVSGPCFDRNSTYKIRYDNRKETNCTPIDLNNAACEIPFLGRVGRIPIALSVNGNFTFEGFILSKDVPIKPEIEGLNVLYPSYQLKNETISWNVEDPLRDSLNYGVFAVTVDQSTNESQVLLLNENASKNGTVIDLSLILKQRNSPIRSAFIAVAKFRNMSGVIIHHFFTMNLIHFYGELDANSTCREWYDGEPNPTSTMNGLPPCWRTLTLVNGNFPEGFGDFRKDPLCNPQNPKLCDFYQPGAKACYTSISKFNGAGQQCCYSSSNRLLVGPPGGGTMDAGHPDNALEHLIKDIYPFFVCCKLSANCNLYYEKRPSDDGSRWEPPVTSGGSGDPHFLTLDGLSYTYNGYGEYILLEIDEIKFSAQVRMTPYKNQQGKIMDGTVFSAVAVQGEGMDTIQIELNTAKTVDIFLNGFVFEIENENLEYIELDGAYLYISSDRYFLQFVNGINIEIKITEDFDALLIVATVPSQYKTKTKGLLGNMDGIASNDFILPNGTVLALNSSNDREIFFEFGEYWRTNENNSAFSYFEGFTEANFMDLSFTPKFISDGIQFQDIALEALAREQCGDNKFCLFDVSTTGQLSIGNMTFEFDETIEIIKESIEEAAKACVPLSTIFENGAITMIPLENGYEYHFSCDNEFCIKGEEVIKCEDSVYNNDPPKCVKCNTCVPLNITFQNGVMTNTTLINGYEYQFACNEKYCLEGEKEIKCVDSVYNHDAPKCVECNTCVPLNITFQNGVMTNTTLINGYEYQFTCNEKYCLEGEKEIKCVDSVYNHDVPKCVKCNTCVPLDITFQNGVMTNTTLINGYEYQFTCNEKYCLEGEKEIKCVDSVYNHDAPKCLRCKAYSIISQLWVILACLAAYIERVF